jgi:hypothetical protein
MKTQASWVQRTVEYSLRTLPSKDSRRQQTNKQTNKHVLTIQTLKQIATERNGFLSEKQIFVRMPKNAPNFPQLAYSLQSFILARGILSSLVNVAVEAGIAQQQ